MPNTHLSIQGESFLINGALTYRELEGSNPDAHGLLMNARFIQGIFDDKANPERFARFGKGPFEPRQHTQGLIDALPEWYTYGLRAFTVGFQGGGPCFTIANKTINNNPFGEDGKQIDPAYVGRMDSLIQAADELGMIVIVSYFYPGQAYRLKDGKAVRNAVVTASEFLKEGGYSNVIIEVANEMDLQQYAPHTIINTPEGMASLLDLARDVSGGLPVGCSGRGGYINREVAEASDVILIHGNGQSRQHYYNMIHTIKSWNLKRPIVCNEDSQAIGQLAVAFKTRTSWGYYNNMSKQEPPANWAVTKGEDQFFARRMAARIGIELPELSFEEQYHLQGLEPEMTYEGKRWLRLASLYPETIDYVDFYRNDELLYTAYDEPFMLYFRTNWLQDAWEVRADDAWKAVVHLRDGNIIEKTGATG